MITRDSLTIGFAGIAIAAVLGVLFATYKEQQDSAADWAQFMQSVERRKICAYIPRTALDSAAYDKCIGEETPVDKCKEKGGDYMVVVSKMTFAKCVRWIKYKEIDK